MSMENENKDIQQTPKRRRDPVSNKNDMIIDVISEIICDDMAKVLGEPLPHNEQIETRLRLGSLHDIVEFYRDTISIEEEKKNGEEESNNM